MEATANSNAKSLRQIGYLATVVGLALFACVGMLLAARRFMQPDIRPLDPVATVLSVAFCAAVAMILRTAWRQPNPRAPWKRWCRWLAPTFCLLLLGVTVSLPQLSLWALTIIWCVILAEESLMLYRDRQWLFGRLNEVSDVPSAAVPSPTETLQQRRESETLAPQATQAIIRSLLADGAENIVGTLRASFAPGQRAAIVHVGFCPPLAAVPEMEWEQSSGPEAEVKLTNVLPHGARFDVRLRRALDDAQQVEFAFHAVAKSGE